MAGTTVSMGDLLRTDILTMRRNPDEFTVTDGAKCKFCYKRVAFDLAHELNPTAGSWCPIHGWLHFDSVKIRPIGDEYVPKRRRKPNG